MPTTPGSSPPCPGSMKTVFWERPKLTHAPCSTPPSATCSATCPGPDSPIRPARAGRTDRAAPTIVGSEKTHVSSSATMSAERSAEAESGAVALIARDGALLVFELNDEVHDQPVGRGGRVRSAALEVGAAGAAVGVQRHVG